MKRILEIGWLCVLAFLFLPHAETVYAAGIVVDTTAQVLYQAGAEPTATATPTNTDTPTPTEIPTCLFGPCSADNLFPIVIPAYAFYDENGDGVRDVHYESTDPVYDSIFWENAHDGLGFHYVYWQNINPSSIDIAAAMGDPSLSGTWQVGEAIPGVNLTIDSAIRQQWVNKVGSSPIVIPVYDGVYGYYNTQYPIVGFLRFRVTGVCRYNDYVGDCKIHLSNSVSGAYMQGKFQDWVSLPTATATHTPTFTAMPGFPDTPTATSTPTSTDTPMPTATATLTPTPKPTTTLDDSTDVNGTVCGLTVDGDDVYVAGLFSRAGSLDVNGIARWNNMTRSWHSLGDGIASGFAQTVVVDGNDVFVGGAFMLNGTGAYPKGIARYDKTTEQWSYLGQGVDGYVYALAVSGDYLYFGGELYTAGGNPVNNIARWNRKTETWSALGAGVNYPVTTIAVVGEDVYVGWRTIYTGRRACSQRHRQME